MNLRRHKMNAFVLKSLTSNNLYVHGLCRKHFNLDTCFMSYPSIIVSDMLGASAMLAGPWNMTLRDYSQTTRVRRSGAGAGLEVRVQIDHIGDMDLHIGNLLQGRITIGMS
ncbi:hypothetical protein MSG28_000564 [Choristoneura fumiferana]|uniref:Uncharacterized protein n=1 Tax=Choristoneura fumiferana TaxID=7141 RepID=A0ACC0K1E8_CHOFU|nr:hypothetical protein MSG28_000564 [Choristoneura fumiferana]